MGIVGDGGGSFADEPGVLSMVEVVLVAGKGAVLTAAMLGGEGAELVVGPGSVLDVRAAIAGGEFVVEPVGDGDSGGAETRGGAGVGFFAIVPAGGVEAGVEAGAVPGN